MGGWTKFSDLSAAAQAHINQAVIKGGNDTLAQSVIQAKQNHPGWKNVTGAAEGSIALRGMQESGGGHFKGQFGSYGVIYFKWLEIGTERHNADHTIRRAADVTFPHVWENVRKYL